MRELKHLLALLAWCLCMVAHGGEAQSASQDPVLEARMLSIASELRCLVCQNQTIADSNSGLAQDLRQQIREQLRQGLGEAEIRDFMTARYGDFVLYRPPFNAATALLWLGPAVLLVLGLVVLGRVLRRRQRLSPEAFEPDPDADDDRHPA
jgi:cytochrome c-type biogenesis protein CcmH